MHEGRYTSEDFAREVGQLEASVRVLTDTVAENHRQFLEHLRQATKDFVSREVHREYAEGLGRQWVALTGDVQRLEEVVHEVADKIREEKEAEHQRYRRTVTRLVVGIAFPMTLLLAQWLLSRVEWIG